MGVEYNILCFFYFYCFSSFIDNIINFSNNMVYIVLYVDKI